jgi:hypothetical protein
MCHFWKWFQKNEEIYIDFIKKHRKKKDFEYHFNELQVHARACSQWLAVDLSPAGKKQGHLIITAHGRPRGFKRAEQLVAKAPTLQNWTVTALRPPNPVGQFMKREDCEIDIGLSKMWFQSCGPGSRGRRGIIVFVEYILPGQEAAMEQFVWDTLENLVGERGVGLDIDFTELDALCNAIESKKLYGMEELPAFVEKFRRTKDKKWRTDKATDQGLTVGPGGEIKGF